MITFILGRSGVGKTHTLRKAIQDELKRAPDGPPLLFLLPEQATFQAEQGILSDPELPGMTRCEVLSFTRLAHRVFSRAGMTRDAPLSAVGKLLLMERAYRQVEDRLQILPRGMGHHEITQIVPGFTRLLRNAQTPESLAALAGKVSSQALSRKLNDLGLWLEAYLSLLSESSRDPDLLLSRLLSVLARTDDFRGVRIWVDGFADFSGQEREVLKVLAKRAEAMTMALLMEPDARPAPVGTGLFASIERTYHILCRDFRNAGVKIGPTVRLSGPPKRFSRSAPLRFLAERLFQDHGKGEGFPDPPEGLTLMACTTQRKEAESAVRYILSLVVNEGLRYRDIAIITRDLSEWHHLLATLLNEHDIPFFIDRRRSLRHHPLVTFLGVLGDMLQDDFAPEAMRTFLKTGLTVLSPDEADILENHLLRCGLRGERWWSSKRAAGLSGIFGGGADDHGEGETAEALRQQLSESLSPWRVYQHGRATPAEWGRRLYDFVEAAGVLERVLAWADAAEASGALDLAQEHTQAAGHFKRFLDDVVSASGGEALSAAGFFRLLNTGFAHWDVGLTPPSLDQILVGGIERSRHPELKAVLLLGFNEGSFPGSVREDPLMPDGDIDQLAEAGFPIWQNTRDQLCHERLLVYIALTRASRRLYISYASVDPAGRRRFPSGSINDIQNLFPKLEMTPMPDGFALATTAQRVAEGVLQARRDGRADRPWEALVERLNEEPAAGEVAAALDKCQAVGHRRTVPESLPVMDSEVADAAASKTVWVTALETFAKCPFQYFARHRLGLQERMLYQLGGREVGTLRHAVLEACAKTLIQRRKGLYELDDKAVEELLSKGIKDVLNRASRAAMEREAVMAYRIDRITDELRVFLFNRRLLEDHGKWHPHRAEHAMAPLSYTIGGSNVLVQGKIDRIDRTVREAGPDGLCLYDFKTRADFTFDGIFHGLDLQLPLYLTVLRREARKLCDGPASVCGAFFQNTLMQFTSKDGPEKEKPEGLLARLKPKGMLTLTGLSLFEPALLEKGGKSRLFNGSIKKKDLTPGDRNRSCLMTEKEMELLLAHVNIKVEEILTALLNGRMAAEPAMFKNKSACAHCRFSGLCRFDGILDRKRYQTFERLKLTRILDLLQDGGA